jgi:serine/threonine protein kinase
MDELDPNAAVADSQALESLMVRVADEFIDRLNRGEQPDVEDYAGRHPQIAGLLRQMLPALQLLRVPATAVGAAGGTAAAATPEAECLGDFRLLREVGRGGMGVVYEAEQRSLGRRVAVKVLPFAAALDARHLQRFQNEAHAAAQLHHTHIVPVYAVGCERGVHFYAMQFIDGRTLAAVIDELRRSVGRGTAEDVPGPDSSAAAPDTAPRADLATERSVNDPEHFRMVARLGVQAAEALEYAHRLGVVHRDVKPANLLVDAGGNLWITDFGLAQLQCETKLTLSGDLLGTLRYMSPEQTLGGRAPLDHRTDVYSLGATLYELLTLEPVFPGRDRQELLHQIALVEPVLPRRRNRAIPPELETVVLKALAKNQAERYATAQEFGDDLQRFLDNRPIQAKRPNVWQRVRKWTIRHRPWVRAAVLTAFVVLLLAVGLLSWSYRQILHEHQRAEMENAHKERNLRLSLQALDEVFLQVADERLPVDAEPEEVDRKFLQSALKFYEEFARENSRDPLVRLYVGKAYRIVGFARLDLGQSDKGREAWQRSLTVLRDLATEFPDIPEYRQELAKTHYALGTLLTTEGHLAEAEGILREAVALYERLVREQPGNPAHQSGLGAALHYLGGLFWCRGEVAEARRALEKAIACQEAALRANPQDVLVRGNLNDHLQSLGYQLNATGEGAEAEHAYVRARDLATQLARDLPPRYRSLRRDQVRPHLELGSLWGTTGKVPEAEGEFARALDLARELTGANPNLSVYRALEAEAYQRRARVYQLLDRVPEAARDADQAVQRYRSLAARYPANWDYRRGLADTLGQQGRLLQLAGRLTEAEQALREAGMLSEKTAAAIPGNIYDQEILAANRANLGSVLLQGHNLPEARGQLEAAIASLEELVRKCPGVPSFRRNLASAHMNLAIVRRGLNQLPEADAASARALDLLTPLVDQFPGVPEYRATLARALDNRGLLLQRLHRGKEAEAAHRQAIAGQQYLADTYPAPPGYRAALAESQHNLGLLLAAAGPARAGDAEAAFRATLDLRRKLTDECPDWPAYRKDLADTYHRLALVLRDTNRLREAEDAFRESLACRRLLADAAPDDLDYRGHLGAALNHLGRFLRDHGDLDEARHFLEQAVQEKRKALRSRDDGASLLVAYDDLALTLARLHDHEALAREADEVCQAGIDGPQRDHIAARCLALGAQLAAKDDRLPPPRRQELAEDYAARAVTFLRQAVARGFRDAERLRKPPFVALSRRDDFQKVLAELEASTRK